MYRNLNPAALGISGRQSELIELALTHGFRGLTLDVAEIARRSRARGIDTACRFLLSAKIRIGEFSLPIRWQKDEATYRSGLVELKEVAEVAAKLECTSCVATVQPVSEAIPYHENFELHRRRLSEIADVLKPLNIKLGLTFLAARAHRNEASQPFIHEAEVLLTLIRTINHPGVGLTLDTWNWFVGGGAMDQIREVPREQLVAVRLADIPESADLAEVTDRERCLPGDGGIVDFAALVRHLADVDYDGPVTLYPHPSRFTGMTRDAIVQQANATFDTLFHRAGLSRSGKLEPVPAESET